MKRKIKIIALLCLLIISVVGCALFFTGCNEGFTFKKERDGGYVVTGYNGYIEGDTLFIPSEYKGEPVVGIGYQAFKQNGKSSVVIPDSIKYIGYMAFYDCRGIRSITFGKGLTSIGDCAFLEATHNVQKAFDVVFPEGLTSVGETAFRGCKIKSINLPSSLETVSEEAFEGTNISSPLDFPQDSKLKTIGKNAFRNCETTSVTLPADVKTVGDLAFSYCYKLTDVTISCNAASFGKTVFDDCQCLKTVTLNGASLNAASLFNRCINIETIKISENLTSVNTALLDGCKSTPTIEYEGSAKEWAKINGVAAFTKGGNAKIKFKKQAEQEVIDLTDATEVQPYAFYNLSGVQEIKISETLTSIGEKAFEGLKAKVVTAPADKLYLLDLSKTEKLTVIGGGTLKKDDMSSAGALKTFIAEDLTAVEAGAFDGVPIETVTINAKFLPEIKGITVKNITVCGGEEITQSALFGSKNLTEIIIPDTITKISPSAFSGCEKLAAITLPDGLTSLGVGVFDGCKALTEIILPKNVTEIGWGLFKGCAKLKSVEIKGKVTAVGFYAFADCVSLEGIKLNDIVTVGDDAFSGCENLASVALGGGLESIGEGAFFDCSSLTRINFGGTKTAWSFVEKAEGWKDGVPTTCMVYCKNDTVPA